MVKISLQQFLFYLCFFPSGAAIVVAMLIVFAFKYEPEDIPGMAYVISFTLAEGMMLVSAIGIIATVKVLTKTTLVIGLRYLNMVILAASGFVGFATFMHMAS